MVMPLFVVAAFSAVIAAVMCRHPRVESIIWLGCAVLAVPLGLSRDLGWQFRVTQKFRALSWELGFWSDRRTLQEPLVFVVIAAAVMLATALLYFMRSESTAVRVAVAACVYLATLADVRTSRSTTLMRFSSHGSPAKTWEALHQCLGAALLTAASWFATGRRLRRAS